MNQNLNINKLRRLDIQFISICFVGGCLGGLLNSIFVWMSAYSGINNALGIAINPHFTPQWLYLRIVWAGIWGLLFYIPILTKINIYIKATIFMLLPALVQLLIVFPFKLNKGYFGVELGILTPLIVVLANLVWAYTTACWINYSYRNRNIIQASAV